MDELEHKYEVEVKVAEKTQKLGDEIKEDLVRHRMSAVLEDGDDAEVGAAATQGPEEVRVFRGAGAQQLAIRRHDFGADQVVAG